MLDRKYQRRCRHVNLLPPYQQQGFSLYTFNIVPFHDTYATIKDEPAL